MSSYHRIIFSSLLLTGINLFGVDIQNTKEDVFTLIGLDRELNSDFASSALIYEKLFEQTKDSDYLKKSLESYFANKDFKKVIDLTQNNFEKFPEVKEYLMYKYLLTTIILKQYDDALLVAKQLEQYNLPQNSGLIGDLYYILGLNDDALRNYEFGYKALGTPNLVLALANLLHEKLGDKSKAIEYLKIYGDKNGCEKSVCIKLLEYYQIQNNLDGMISVMEKMYFEHKKDYIQENLAKFELMLGELYIQKDKQKGIDFLVETGNNNLLVASMYEQDKLYDKALEILYKTYHQTADDTILGRIAMLDFTIAKDKKLVIKDVLKKFELALKEKSNPEYENFYGYLLIDYDLDVKKGLELVKKAYDLNPQNIAFKDSLAWGYFKNNECKLADKYMSEVVEKVGLEDEEIKLHYDEIKDCIEGKKRKNDT